MNAAELQITPLPGPRSEGLSTRMRGIQRWRDGFDPTQGLTAARARALALDYPQGRFADLMWTFGAPFVGVESADPDYLALIERRNARLLEMDWDIRTADDSPEAQRQADLLRRAYDSFDNLYEAIEHLATASYRGFAHVEVDVEGRSLVPLDQWHLVREGSRGRWGWNPEAKSIGFESIPADHVLDPARHWVLVREVRRPIGAFALMKFARTRNVEVDWDAFAAIFGIPGWVVIGPPNVPTDKEAAYEQAARDIAAGGSGYLPHGSDARPSDSPRGVQPFKERLDHLAQKLVLAGTGGMLTMLNDSTGLGSGQSQSHAETFAQIARAEARKISEVLQRGFDRRILEKAGGLTRGQRALAWFELAAQEESSAGAVVDDVSKLSGAGYVVDLDQVQERTGYKVTMKAPEVPVLPGLAGLPNDDRGQDDPAKVRKAPQAGDPGVTGIETPPEAPKAPERPLVDALQKDLAPLQEKMAEVLAILERGDASPDEVRAAIEDGLKILEEEAAGVLRAGGLARRLEGALAAAVIEGAGAALEETTREGGNS